MFGKPELPRDLEAALEDCGPETIRTILLHGWANPQGMPKALGQITSPTRERDYALAWLKWKDARQSLWREINLIATVVAAAAAVLAAIFGYVALSR